MALVVYPKIVQLTGLAISFVVWAGVGLVTGWSVSRFGMFNLPPEKASNPFLDLSGIILSIISLGFILWIRPESYLSTVFFSFFSE